MLETASDTPKMQSQALSETDIFHKLSSYSFHEDLEFAKGLAIILGHPDTPATEAEINRGDDLVLQAKSFYFSRKEKLTPPINVAAYKSWLASNSGKEPESTLNNDESNINTSNTTAQPATNAPATSTSSQEPAYPSSFAHIVELITTGQPIPGIQEIPDTVLTGQETSSTKSRRRKPWEKEDETKEGLSNEISGN